MRIFFKRIPSFKINKMSLVIKGLYRHYKGNAYVIEAIAHLEKTGEKMVVYRPLTETKHYVRPQKEFEEMIDSDTPRFQRLERVHTTLKLKQNFNEYN